MDIFTGENVAELKQITKQKSCKADMLEMYILPAILSISFKERKRLVIKSSSIHPNNGKPKIRATCFAPLEW